MAEKDLQGNSNNLKVFSNRKIGDEVLSSVKNELPEPTESKVTEEEWSEAVKNNRKIDADLIVGADASEKKIRDGKIISTVEASQIRADEMIHGKRPKAKGSKENPIDLVDVVAPSESAERKETEDISPETREVIEDLTENPTQSKYKKFADWLKTRSLLEGFFLRQEAKNLKKEGSKLKTEQEGLLKQRKDYLEKINNLESKKEEFLANMEDAGLDAVSIDEVMRRIDDKISDLREEIADLEDREDEIVQDAEDFEAGAQQHEREADDFVERVTKEFRQKIEGHEQTKEEILERRKEVRAQITLLRGEKRTTQRRLVKLRKLLKDAEIGEMIAEVKRIKDLEKDYESTIKQKKKELGSALSQVDKYDKDLKKADKEIARLQKKIDKKIKKNKKEVRPQKSKEEMERDQKDTKKSSINKGLAMESEMVDEFEPAEEAQEVDETESAQLDDDTGWEEKMDALRQEGRQDVAQMKEEERKKEEKAEERMAFWAAQNEPEVSKVQSSVIPEKKVENSQQKTEKEPETFGDYVSRWNKLYPELPLDFSSQEALKKAKTVVDANQAKEGILDAVKTVYIDSGKAIADLEKFIKNRTPRNLFNSAILAIKESRVNDKTE